MRAIVARHARSCAVLAPADRAFRQFVMPDARERHVHRHEHNLELSFAVRLVRQSRQRTEIRPFTVWRNAAAARTLPPPPRRDRDLIERIFAREHRIDASTYVREVVERVIAARRPVAGRAEAGPPLGVPAGPIEMVVRHPAAPQPRDPVPSTPEPAGAEREGRRGALPRVRAIAPAAPIPLTSAELTRLTDQVVTAIDRRFVAHRERRGRI